MIKHTKYGDEYLVKKFFAKCSLCATENTFKGGWFKQTYSLQRKSENCYKCGVPFYFVIPAKIKYTLPMGSETIY